MGRRIHKFLCGLLLLICLSGIIISFLRNEDAQESGFFGQSETEEREEAQREFAQPEETGEAQREALETETQKEAAMAMAQAIEREEERILNLSAGEMAAAGMVEAELTHRLFFASAIGDELLERILGKSYVENENIDLSELSYLKMLYVGFDGNTYVGEMIVNQKIEAEILSIFKTLYENQYPIEKMVLIDAYQADDEMSMRDNNTSAFNYRTVAGSQKLSNHSFGMAVDLNPKYNPYVKITADGKTVCQPECAMEYADRSREFDYKIDENDLAYQLFTDAGFTWGGNFRSVKDYQHFEKEID